MRSYGQSNLTIWKGYKISFCRSGHIKPSTYTEHSFYLPPTVCYKNVDAMQYHNVRDNLNLTVATRMSDILTV